MAYKIRKLRDLKEGDKFRFVNFVNAGTFIPLKLRVYAPDFYVEGQYPGSNCTTVFRSTDITKDGYIKEVLGVFDRQDVVVMKRNALHISHKVYFN